MGCSERPIPRYHPAFVSPEAVTANGLEFGFLEAGSGPLALCLHGFPDSARTWRHLLPALADAGFHAVAPYMRGYAPTAVPADGVYHPGALIADATALHEALGGDERAVLIGHDWGARATYGAAAFAPDRWRRVVTLAVPAPGLDGIAFSDYEQLKRFFYFFFFHTPVAEHVVAADDLAFLERLWRDWSPGYDASEDLPQAKASLRAPENLAAALGYYRATFAPSDAYTAELAALAQPMSQPTLYLHGESDGCIAADIVKDAESHLPAGSRLQMIEGAGHFLHLERPDEVNAHIVEWVS
jgi:pimeloyl-ACP methyl ester carboxylesterase